MIASFTVVNNPAMFLFTLDVTGLREPERKTFLVFSHHFKKSCVHVTIKYYYLIFSFLFVINWHLQTHSVAPWGNFKVRNCAVMRQGHSANELVYGINVKKRHRWYTSDYWSDGYTPDYNSLSWHTAIRWPRNCSRQSTVVVSLTRAFSVTINAIW